MLAAPQRIADTRSDGDTVDDINQATGKVASGQVLEVRVAGRAGISATATTAVLNVTVTDSELPGFLTVYPCDRSRPNSSNVNYQVGQVVANSVTAKLDGSGRTCVFTSATSNIVVDVTGTLPSTTFVPLDAPARLVDTRPDGETIDNTVEKTGFRREGTTLQFPVGGRATIPAGATAVVLNVTASEAAAAGFMTLHPRNSARPNASNLNFQPGGVAANTVIAALGGNGMVCLFSSADVQAIVDVAGYFVGPAPADSGKNCPQAFKPGTYPVGPYQMPAGRYVSAGNGADAVCEVYRMRTDNISGGVLGDNLVFGSGRLLIDVRPTDPFVLFRFDACNALVPYETAGPPATSFTDGFHVVNQHVAPGTYRASRIPGMVCGAQRLSSFDGSSGAVLEDIYETTATTVTLVVKASDVGILTGNGCTTWTKVG